MEKLELNSNNNVKREETEKSAEEAASDFGLDHRLADDIVSGKEEVGAEKERFKRRAQELVDGKRFDFELFAESAAPRFRFSVGFYMLFEKKRVQSKWKSCIASNYSKKRIFPVCRGTNSLPMFFCAEKWRRERKLLLARK